MLLKTNGIWKYFIRNFFFATGDTDMQILEESAECVYKNGYEQRLWEPPVVGWQDPPALCH